MENATKIVLIAVAVIIVAVIIVSVFSLVNSGQSLLSTGKAQVNESIKNYGEIAYTQYDGAIIAGSQVTSVIKTEWKAENTVAIIVCTKDNNNSIFDYSGITTKAITTDTDKDGEQIRSGFPNDCNGVTVASSSLHKKFTSGGTVSSFKDGAFTYAKTNDVIYDGNNGYNSAAKSNDIGFVSPSANFKGSVQRDRNGNVRCMVFVQQ